MDFVLLLLLLLGFHFICDYPLQGDFIARYKERWIADGPNPIWYHCLTAHSFIHMIPVLLLTGSVCLGILMLVTHWLIDFMKCEGKLTFNQDQALHIIVILLISILYYFNLVA